MQLAGSNLAPRLMQRHVNNISLHDKPLGPSQLKPA
jgi:hypothetical protein